ncbi:MAG TPA: biopolymer transporter ExbD [Gammaproteobacteria bacterium]|nr:biopolymer transporter ExbD [Gammaproteobacteria bacterium]
MTTRLRRRRQPPPVDLNITAFMNLMVALVPFLLIMAVFSRLAIIELSLPQASAAASDEPPLNLEVVIRKDKLVVSDHAGGLMRELPNRDGHYDLDSLSAVLQQLKARAPDTVQATLLLEPDLTYEQLVRVIDTVRTVPVQQDEQVVEAELFPEISIGDAPQPARRS